MFLDVKLDRVDRVYRPGEFVTGKVVVDTPKSTSHNGVQLRAEGLINLQLSARSVGLFEAFYSSIKPLQLMFQEDTLVNAGRFEEGRNELPFRFEDLHETYHGVYVNTIYTIKVEIVRGALQRNITKDMEFMVEIQPKPEAPVQQVEFRITPDSLENVRKSALSKVPPFVVSGVLHRSTCPVNIPLTGELMVEESDAEIKSIELQLVRVETVVYTEGSAREATEIQSVQIADGDVTRNLSIPIFMVLPRLFSCPTTIAGAFKIEYELNLILVFKSGFMVTENFPLNLTRTADRAVGAL